MTRVLLVGGGLTSAVTGSLLRRHIPTAELVLWDKARGAGGRMSTSRSPHDPTCTVDLGAQYISATPEYSQLHSTYYEELVASGVLAPLTCKVVGMRASQEGTRHYVAPSGVSSIVKYYLKEANLDPRWAAVCSVVDNCVLISDTPNSQFT